MIRKKISPLNKRKEVKHAGEQELTGVFAWQTYRKDSFIIGRLTDGSTILGDIASLELAIGNTYRFFGKWVEDQKYGKQFKFTCVIQDTPLTEDGIVKYLCDNVPGIGEAKARLLFAIHKDKTVDALADNPQIADGILTPEKAVQASKILSSMVATRRTTIDLLSIFARRGFRKTLVHQCIERWGTAAADKIRENPYNLILEKFNGCGFKNTDKLYLDLGKSPTSLQRQMLCGWHALRSDRSGHTWFPVKKIFEAIRSAISSSSLKPVEAIKEGVKGEWLTLWNKSCDLESGRGWITERKKALEEAAVANEFKRLLSSTNVLWPELNPEDGFSESQLNECTKAISTQVAILVGTPGTGKTYCAGSIVRACVAKFGESSVACCAPTGKAAVRLTQSLNKHKLNVVAKTIHSLLKMGVNDDGDFDFEHGAHNRLTQKVFVVDEMSMCGVGLLSRFFSALPDGAHVLLIGDKYQLPPVEHGAPLRDLIKFHSSVGELTEIWRNSGDIVKSCAAMKDGSTPFFRNKFDDSQGHNLRLVTASNTDLQIDALRKFLLSAIGNGVDPFTEIQVITPINGKSAISRSQLNPMLQNLLNSGGHRTQGCKYRVGDKIICLRNSKLWSVNPSSSKDATQFSVKRDLADEVVEEYVANGEIGRVIAVAEKRVIACFQNPLRIVIANTWEDKRDDGESESMQFDLAYAVTCHKMQGSQDKYIVVMADEYQGAGMICSREWWYTALSRAEYRCLVIGKLDVIKKHCSRVSIEDRRTFLVRRLEHESSINRKGSLAKDS